MVRVEAISTEVERAGTNTVQVSHSGQGLAGTNGLIDSIPTEWKAGGP